MKEPIHAYLRRRLEEVPVPHLTIARESGVPQTTLSRVYRGAMPRLSTAEGLLNWFERYDRAQAGAARRRKRPESAAGVAEGADLVAVEGGGNGRAAAPLGE